jgi:hypothetical protein
VRSWQVQVAAALVWLGLLPAAACAWAGVVLMRSNDMLIFVAPILACVCLGAALVLGAMSVTFAVQLRSADPRARLSVLLLGCGLAVLGALALLMQPLAGVVLLAWGAALVWLMTTDAAKRDLGNWFDGMKQPAPWGRTPGTGVWSSAPAQQGPWSPDPTAVPWLGWQGHSGPRPPWWETWQAGLAQGLPAWELVVLALAAPVLGIGLVAVLVPGHRGLALLIAPAIAAVAFVEQRMRRRLSGR